MEETIRCEVMVQVRGLFRFEFGFVADVRDGIQGTSYG